MAKKLKGRKGLKELLLVWINECEDSTIKLKSNSAGKSRIEPATMNQFDSVQGVGGKEKAENMVNALTQAFPKLFKK